MRLNILSRTLLLVLVPQSFLALILGYYFIQGQITEAHREMTSAGTRFALYLATNAEFSLISGDYSELNRMVQVSVADADPTEAIVILDSEMNIVVSTGEEDEVATALGCWRIPTNCSWDDSRMVFMHDITNTGVSVSDNLELLPIDARKAIEPNESPGTVIILFNAEYLREWQKQLIMNGVGIVLITMLIAIVMAMTFARGLSLPILRMSRFVSRIQTGDFSVRAEQSASGELRALETGINDMAQKMKEANANLQSKVKQATSDLSETLVDLEVRNKQLIHAREIAEKANSAKELFLAKMSHELRTPLATVIGYSRLLMRADNSSQKREYGQIIDQAVDILQTTIDDILDYVKLQSDVVHLEDSEFDLLDVLEDAVAMHVPMAQDKRLELISCCDDSLPERVIGDPARLVQILTNLLGNAIKFTESGSVELSAKAEYPGQNKSRILISVKDSGMGISAEQQSHLFQPFVQADDSINRLFGGTGLGLSIVSRIAESMGGEVSLFSEPGLGTEVKLELYLRVSAAGPRMAKTQLDANEYIVGYDSNKELGGIISRTLQSMGGKVSYHVDIDYFFNYIKQVNPSLVIYTIRKLDGLSKNLSRIRSEYSGPVLLLTSDPEALEYVESRGLRAAEKVLIKPVRRESLRSTCRELIRNLPGDNPLPAIPAANIHLPANVLVVEDNELNLRLITTQLEELGASVTAAKLATEALEILTRELPDLVLLDVHMPGMDGVTLAGKIRQNAPDLPVYALTANVMGTEEVDLLRAGVRKIFYKPMSQRNLVALLSLNQKYKLSVGSVMSVKSDSPEQSRLELPNGISAAEVLNELQSMHTKLLGLLERGNDAALTSVCHDLQGVARLFARGPLLENVTELSQSIRNSETNAAVLLLETFQQEVTAMKLLYLSQETD